MLYFASGLVVSVTSLPSTILVTRTLSSNPGPTISAPANVPATEQIIPGASCCILERHAVST